MGDILDRGNGAWWERGAGVTLDELYRSALTRGLQYHEEAGRGLLPAGLVAEIQASGSTYGQKYGHVFGFT